MRIAISDANKTMNFNFTRNIHFTKLIKAANRLREFNFRLLPGTSNSLLHVDVPDDRGNRIMFKMQKADNQWRIVEDEHHLKQRVMAQAALRLQFINQLLKR